ncbi:MAG: hypothetical protein ABIH37_05775 [archaeon]
MSAEPQLEERINSENIKPSFLETSVGLVGGTAGAIVSYNTAGAFATASKFSENADMVITAALLTIGTIGGYKLGTKLTKKIKRNLARTKTLREISQDPEFLNRQEIKREKLGIAKSALKYLVTIPAGGVLGHIPGTVGMVPLCMYFGEKYEWSDKSSLLSGVIAGPMIGAYAFAEMTAKKQYERLATTAFALAGVAASVNILNSLNHNLDVWPWLGVNTTAAFISGTIGNTVYKGLKKLTNYSINITRNDKKIKN